MLWLSPSVRRIGRRRFKFENLWLKETHCKELVHSCWQTSRGLHLPARIELCGKEIWKWGKGFTRNFQNKIETCKYHMSVLRRIHDVEGVQKFVQVQKEYLRLLEQQNSYWRQRAKEFWLKDGDINSKFFHNAVKRMRRNNNIVRLKNSDGNWISEKDELDELVFQHFNQLFNSSRGNMSTILNCIPQTITQDHNLLLIRTVTREEVRKALFSMDPNKSPGLDGMSPGFYQHFWDLISTDTVQYCDQFVKDGILPDGINRTQLILIPKKYKP